MLKEELGEAGYCNGEVMIWVVASLSTMKQAQPQRKKTSRYHRRTWRDSFTNNTLDTRDLLLPLIITIPLASILTARKTLQFPHPTYDPSLTPSTQTSTFSL